MTIPEVKTNAVKFGQYAIILSKDQLEYYLDGQLTNVRDVKSDFNFVDLYELATRIAEKKEAGEVKFVHKDEIVKRHYR
jgi:hypothetical protein